MTVSTEVSREEYTGNGVTTDFDYRFRVFKAADLVVSVADTTETITVLTLNTDYTVTGAGSRTGGKVKLLSPLALNWRISIERALPVTQETDIRNQGNFFPEVHEDAFDKLTMLIQQVWSYFGLALRKPTWLSKYYDALGNRIANLGNPINPQDAATKSYVDAVGDSWFKRTLRVPESFVRELPGVAGRRNKIIACDNDGQPIMVLPESGSAADVLIEFNKPDGFRLIGAVNGVNQLSTIAVQDGDRVQLLDVWGWAGVRVPIGTGILRYDANRAKSEHDGFIHFSPTVPFTTLTNYLNGTGETDVSGTGVFVRENYGNEVLLSHCGIYPLTSSVADIATATNACTKLFYMCSKGYSICFDVDLFVSDINVTNINFRCVARFSNKLKLGKNGRILKLHNSAAMGSVTLISPNLDGNGFKSIEDGGLLQSNFIKSLDIKDPVISGFVSVEYQANGIATTGIGCRTSITGGDLSNCGSQLLYLQTSKTTLVNPYMHDSVGHGVAFVNCDDLYWIGGAVTGCNYGILTYSTDTYRSNLRRFHVQGVSLRGNNKAFEISRRYEVASVSQGNADVVLSDVDATGCTLASTLGNLATDNVDGFALREVFLNNVFIDNYIESNSVFGLHVIGGRNNGVRIRGKYENIEVRPAKMYGNTTAANTNCAVYFYASATGKNVMLDSFSYYGFNSFIYAESGAVASGPIVVNNPVVDPLIIGGYKVNSEFYGYVSFNSGNRVRDMSRQVWGVGKSPFYDTTLGKFVTWNGANITDMAGNIVP